MSLYCSGEGKKRLKRSINWRSISFSHWAAKRLEAIKMIKWKKIQTTTIKVSQILINNQVYRLTMRLTSILANIPSIISSSQCAVHMECTPTKLLNTSGITTDGCHIINLQFSSFIILVTNGMIINCKNISLTTTQFTRQKNASILRLMYLLVRFWRRLARWEQASSMLEP